MIVRQIEHCLHFKTDLTACYNKIRKKPTNKLIIVKVEQQQFLNYPQMHPVVTLHTASQSAALFRSAS